MTHIDACGAPVPGMGYSTCTRLIGHAGEHRCSAADVDARNQPESPKSAQRWTAGPWVNDDSRWRGCIVAPKGAPGALSLVRVAEVRYATSEDLAVMTAAPEMASALLALSYAFTRPEWQHAVAAFSPELEAATAALRKAGAL